MDQTRFESHDIGEKAFNEGYEKGYDEGVADAVKAERQQQPERLTQIVQQVFDDYQINLIRSRSVMLLTEWDRMDDLKDQLIKALSKPQKPQKPQEPMNRTPEQIQHMNGLLLDLLNVWREREPDRCLYDEDEDEWKVQTFTGWRCEAAPLAFTMESDILLALLKAVAEKGWQANLDQRGTTFKAAIKVPDTDATFTHVGSLCMMISLLTAYLTAIVAGL